MDILHNASTDLLFDMILTLENREECYKFFEDICTIKELQSVAQRVLVAKMLRDGKVYSDIVDETGASTATISRVNRCLQYGDGGYSQALQNKESEAE
jgi:TrpR-related protein YerC/YecD